MGRSGCRVKLVIALVAIVAASCAPDDARPNLVPASSTTTSTTTTVVPSARAIGQPPSSVPRRIASGPDPDAFQTIVATATAAEISILDEPGGEEISQLANPTESGGPLVFVVDAVGDDWHRVRLPIGPPERRGWVPAEDVELAAHDYRIEVDADDFELRVFQRTVVVFNSPIGIDPDDIPPPGPSTYITELLEAAEPNPVYGTYAYGLSGFSDTFETFTGAAGQVGIHGTTDPDSVGGIGPTGSIRLGDDAIEELVGFLPLGVVVEVV